MKTEVSGPSFDGVAADANLLLPLRRLVEHDGDRVIALTREGDRFVDWTAEQIADRVRAVAKGLVACGVEPGDRVALMSHTRLEWMIVDLAVMSAGAVTVPVYETSSVEQLAWILEDSGAVAAVVETAGMLALYHDVREEASTLSTGLHDRTGRWSGGPRRSRNARHRCGRRRHRPPIRCARRAGRSDRDLHVRNDRQAEGMRADARQPVRERGPDGGRARFGDPARRRRAAVLAPGPLVDQGQPAVQPGDGRANRFRHRCRPASPRNSAWSVPR